MDFIYKDFELWKAKQAKIFTAVLAVFMAVSIAVLWIFIFQPNTVKHTSNHISNFEVKNYNIDQNV